MYFEVICLLISLNHVALNAAGLRRPLTWYEAHNKCSQTGGKLPSGVRVISSEELGCRKLSSYKGKEYWTGDITILSEFISIEGCFENTEQFNTHRIGGVPFENCNQMCNGSFIYKFEIPTCIHETPSSFQNSLQCFCVLNSYSVGSRDIVNCYRGIMKERTDWWLFGGKYKSLNTFGLCIPCSQNPHKDLCLISRFLEAHKVQIFNDMNFCYTNGNNEIGLFRQKIITTLYNDSSFKSENIINCGYIQCESRIQNYGDLQYKNCSLKTGYFCNLGKQEPTALHRPLPYEQTSESITVSPTSHSSRSVKVSNTHATGANVLTTIVQRYITMEKNASINHDQQTTSTSSYSTSSNLSSSNQDRNLSIKIAGSITGGIILIIVITVVAVFYVVYRKHTRHYNTNTHRSNTEQTNISTSYTDGNEIIPRTDIHTVTNQTSVMEIIRCTENEEMTPGFYRVARSKNGLIAWRRLQ